jgi:hypothetical protein
MVQRGDALLPQFTAWYHRLRRLPRRTRRALQRRAALSLGGLALLFALGQGPAQAAVIEVNEGTCTLANAITAANTDTATGGCLAGSGADILRLEPPGRTVTLRRALPAIQSEITIDGQQGTIERANNAPAFNILEVAELEGPCPPFTLQNTTITGGNPNGVLVSGCYSYNEYNLITIENSTISGNSGIGIGILPNLSNANLIIRHSTITDNGDAGAIGKTVNIQHSTVTDNGGEGISGSSVNIQHSTVSGNNSIAGISAYSARVEHSTISDNNGYGISVLYGGFSVHNSVISRNTEAGIGIFNTSVEIHDSIILDNGGAGVRGEYFAAAVINNSTISGNEQGGVLGYESSVTINNSTISGNGNCCSVRSTNYCGNAFTGGVWICGNNTVINNSTISGNISGGSGGGISHNVSPYGIREPSLLISNSTITGNTSYMDGGGIFMGFDSLELSHSVISGNTAAGPGTEIAGSPTLAAGNFNIFGTDNQAGVNVEGFTPGPTDIVPAAGVNVSDILDPDLADNGGPTPTHALVPGSPAIDAGDTACTDANGNPLTTDQRGQPRPADGDGDGVATCDIGAFELQLTGLSQIIDFEAITAGTVVTEVFSHGGFGPIQVKGKRGTDCPSNAAVVFNSNCPSGLCSGDDQDLGSPNETFGGPGQGKGGEADSRFANDEPLGNLLIVHEVCDELSEGVVQNPDDTGGGSTITLKFPEPVRVFSYTIIDNERDERDQVTLLGEQGEPLATLSSPVTGNNGKAVVQTTSDGTGIGGVIQMVFDRKGSRGLDNIVFLPEASVSAQHSGFGSRH